jgi:DNA-binding MarR family transcriptional regulator
MRNGARAIESADSESRVDSIREPYLQALTLVERLHHRLLEVIKDEFDRRGRRDITPVQALMLYSIGDQNLCVGELRTRGYYLGTNVTYNLKKLVGAGLVEHQRSRVDRRSVHIKLTDKGREAHDLVEALCLKHANTVELAGGINAGEFATLNKLLHRLERFWTDQVVYRL